MRKSGFYPKLAAQSMRKNGKVYLPYLLTCIATSAMFYIMLYLQGNEGVSAMRGAPYVGTVMMFGSWIIAIFSAILLYYTNSFIMRRRSRELGLYNILGMEKRHLAIIMLWETVFTAIIGIVGGIAVGALLSKLMLLLLCSVLNNSVPFGFEISVSGIWTTVAVYCVIFLLNLLANLRRVGKAKPIELLYSTKTGEREPKTRWALTVLGVLTLGTGYAIALVVQSPLEALFWFFVAVLLVIIGTYCLFISGSIAVLKLMRKNKRYYYKTKHFTTVSGMLYRMKRNAAGLASICILSTMVLVTVSSTLCLYLGLEETVEINYPRDIAVTYRNPGEDVIDDAIALIREEAEKEGLEITALEVSKTLEVNLHIAGDGNLDRDDTFEYYMSDPASVIVYFITDSQYSRLMGRDVSLADGEALAQAKYMEWSAPEAIDILGSSFSLRQIDDFPVVGDISSYVAQILCFVITEADMYRLNDAVIEVTDNRYTSVAEKIGFDLDADDDTQIEFFGDVSDSLIKMIAGEYTDENGELKTYTYDVLSFENKAESAAELYAMYGGFFFLGIFLGSLFLMATVLIIYYKQVSEGYEDAERFKIMQQVGMSEREVRQSIKSQVMTVFFLPLAMAGLHITAAFPMLTRLLSLFKLDNSGLFMMCCAGVILAFAVAYALIYTLTARAYYQIVK